MKFAIIVSRFNPEICTGLLNGAKTYLQEKNINIQEEDIFYAPGAFEIPLLAQSLATKNSIDGVICLGCVIKGDTAHFEYISESCAHGLMQASLHTKKPITFGILTTYEPAQAIVRSREDEHNKGREAAAACVESVEALQIINN